MRLLATMLLLLTSLFAALPASAEKHWAQPAVAPSLTTNVAATSLMQDAMGAALGASAFVPFILLTTVFGGVLAWRARRSDDDEIAYAPAMLAGLAALLPVVVLVR